MPPDEPIDVAELRRAERYVALDPIPARYGAVDVIIDDLSEGGFQIEHGSPVKLGSSAWIDFENPRTFETIEFRCRVVWSRLSSRQDTNGRPLYRSGVRIEDADEKNRSALQRLLKQATRPDTDSMEKKKKKLRAAAAAKASRPSITIQRQTQMAADQITLIQKTRQRLRADPVEAIKWYNRARYSLSDQDARVVAEVTKQGYREEVLAVWEFLGRKVPLGMIARVFTEKQ